MPWIIDGNSVDAGMASAPFIESILSGNLEDHCRVCFVPAGR